MRAVQGSLTPELLNAEWRARANHPLAGHCYVATEALWYALGARSSVFRPQMARIDDITHWWLEGPGAPLDPTAAQFDDQFPDGFPYELGRGCGFLTKGISARAAVVLARCLAKTTARNTEISGQKVRVYRNLHTGTWSVQDAKSGIVIAHEEQIALRDASFIVRPAGQAKVRATRRKNVHAFIAGTVAGKADGKKTFDLVEQASYNPYRFDTFVTHKVGDPSVTAPAGPADYAVLDAHSRVLVASAK